MEVRPVWEAQARSDADDVCAALRAQGIKCAVTEPTIPYVAMPFMANTPQYTVVVAPEDEQRARDVVGANDA